jgi:DNA-binding response OmpR family regulator
MNKILIVDDDSTTSFILGKNLLKQGYDVETANSAIIGAELMKKEDFSLVITDIDMPEISGLDFLLWIKEHSPKSQVIIMTGNNSPDVKNYANNEGAIKYFEKPVNTKELNDFIKNSNKKGVSGVINDINLSDFINIIILSGKQKLIKVTDKANQQSGKLFIKSGNIIHAEFNSLEGRDAFNAIMRIKNGAFAEIKWEKPKKETIDTPPAVLLQEVAASIELENSSSGSVSEKAEKESGEKILIVDDDPITPLIIEKYFANRNLTIVTADSAIEGSEILKGDSFSLVITDLNMPHVNGLEFLLWIKQHYPHTQVIIITSGGSGEIKKFAGQKGAVGYFEKPVNLKELDTFIKKNVLNKGFSGDLEDIDLLDFIQILAFSGKNKLISVNDPVIKKSGRIYIKDGQIIHAEKSDLTGEDAFYALVKLQNGIFTDLPWEEPEQKTIDVSITKLLTKAIKIKDEIASNKPEEKGLTKKSLIRARPKYLEHALEQREALVKLKKETDPVKKLTIYESGVVLGIVIGRSDKDDVIKKMKNFSKTDAESQRDNQMFIFDDISFTILFNDAEIVESFTFGTAYKGSTGLGISIGDPLTKAIKVYGKPRTCTVKGAVWDNLAFFSMDNLYISSIRLRNANFFSETEKMVNTPDTKAPPKAKTKEELEKEAQALAKSQQKAHPKTRQAQQQATSQLNYDESPEPLDTPKKQPPHPSKPKVGVKAVGKGMGLGVDAEIYTIHENGRVFDIFVGRSTPEDVREVMDQYSERSGESKFSSNILTFEDLGVTFLFDQNDRVKEMNFSKNYPGKTTKGLKVGDEMYEAIDIYGEPQYKAEKSLIWPKIAVFSEDSTTISTIRIKKK